LRKRGAVNRAPSYSWSAVSSDREPSPLLILPRPEVRDGAKDCSPIVTGQGFLSHNRNIFWLTTTICTTAVVKDRISPHALFSGLFLEGKRA